jgi:hypothetical protein
MVRTLACAVMLQSGTIQSQSGQVLGMHHL